MYVCMTGMLLIPKEQVPVYIERHIPYNQIHTYCLKNQPENGLGKLEKL